MESVRPLWRYTLSFLFYSLFGWCYEVFLEVVVYRWGFTNRGVLFGPYCPVYGVGALLFLFLFSRFLRGKGWREKGRLIPALFLGCALAATLVELGASYLCEAISGSWPWQTYFTYKINFQGRIALSPSIRFGLGGVIFLYLFQPLLDKGIAALGGRRARTLSLVVLALVAADLVWFLLKLL